MAAIRTPLGHITMVPRGVYSSSATYNRLNLVTYTGNNSLGVYVAKEDNFTNKVPTNTTYWMKLIDGTDLQGPAGIDGKGIVSISGPANPGQPGNLDTYTIRYSDNSTSSFQVKNGANGQNGKGITSISGPSNPAQSGATDTYTIKYSDNTTSTFQVKNGTNGQNGKGIVSISGPTNPAQSGAIDTYTITYTDNTTSTFQVKNGVNGTDATVSNISNPLTFTLNNDKVEIGLFESTGEANIEIRGTKGGNNSPAIYVTQYDPSQPQSQQLINRLTLLDSTGNTSIPGDTTINGELKLNTVLGTNYGGTGRTTAPSLLVNLGSTNSANPLDNNPRPGVTGTLNVTNGGTGATGPGFTLLNNLGITVTDQDLSQNANLSNGHIILVYEN